MKRTWLLMGGIVASAALAAKWLRMPKSRIFDRVRRTDMTGKKRTENSFAYLSRSGRRGSAESRTLMETWLSRVPESEHAALCARLRSGREWEFTSALQEMTLHELLLRQGCRLLLHPHVAGTAKRPDFSVKESNGLEFLLEACTSTEVASGPSGGARADRIRDFLGYLDLKGCLIAIDEFVEGTKDLSQKVLVKHIEDGIRAAIAGYCDRSISIPPLTTADGWLIELTALPKARYGERRSTVMQEAWSRSWTGPACPLRDALKKKSGPYGNQLAMPYVIAVNSSDAMFTDRDFQDTLFGLQSGHAPAGADRDYGFWGTATRPVHTRVSAVLLTKNLCPPTLLMGQVYACLYVNPWAAQPYDGVLTKLETFRLEHGAVRKCAGAPLHRLLKLRLRDSLIWE